LIDTHCHLTHPKIAADADAAIERAKEAGLTACITIGTGVPDARNCLKLIEAHPGFVFASAGLDPFTCHDLGEGFEDGLAELAALLETERFVAIGEVGLDYHYDLQPRPVQARQLAAQLELAERLSLPVVIHVREAHEDMAAQLAEHPKVRGVIHSFTGGPQEAERYLALGWHLAFNGVLTFKNAEKVREAARVVPVDRLLVETDSPYLAPVPHRGRRCEPAFVAHTLEALAVCRGEEVADLDASTTANARGLFGV